MTLASFVTFLAQYGGGESGGGGGGGGGYSAGFWVLIAVAALVILGVVGWLVSRSRSRRGSGATSTRDSGGMDQAA